MSDFGGPEVLTVGEAPPPQPGAGELLIQVAAAGVNRADLLQRQGLYPPPAGAPEWPGLEVAGTVAAVGDEVAGWDVGDEVCALLPGGGYAEWVAAPADHCLPVPAGLDAIGAAGLVEAACTVWSNLPFEPGGVLLVHGASGGIGSVAVQVGAARGMRVIATAGGAERAERCRELGAEVVIDYRTEDFVEAARDLGGATEILDVIGAAYLERNIAALAAGGRLAIIGLQGGRAAEIDLASLMAKRATVTGTTLRARPDVEKAAIVAAVRADLWPLVPADLSPVIHQTFPLEHAAAAHAALEAGGVFGKLVLKVPGD